MLESHFFRNSVSNSGAEGNKNVKGFLSKPLDYEIIISLSEKVFQST